MATNRALDSLRAKIRKANKEYHSVGGITTYTDAEYDAMLAQLKKLSPKDPLLVQVGAPPTRGTKVRLPYSMPSLPKVRVGDIGLNKWLEKHPGPYSASDKLDGVSALLTNVKGNLKLYTRGDGSVGTDISHLIPVLRGIATLPKGIAVRGEILITTKSFNSGLSKDFANTRNLASAIVNKTKQIHPAANKAIFVVHEMVRPRNQSLGTSARRLRELGFTVVPHSIIRDKKPIPRLEALLKTRRAMSKSDIDGLVLESANGSRIALKDINEVATATVGSVEWDVSRHRRLKPVLLLEKPVTLAGARVSRATGHNAKFIKDNKIGPGAVITLVRSGEVIPKVISVVHGTKASLPPPGSYEWGVNGTEAISTDVDHDDKVQSRVLVNFLTMLGIKTFQARSMSALVDIGIDTPAKLMAAQKVQLAKAGLGAKRTNDLVLSLKEKLQETDHTTMMVASGCFPPGFGMRRMKLIMKHVGDNLFKYSKVSDLQADLMQINGVGISVVRDFMSGFKQYRLFLREVRWRPTTNKRAVTKVKVTSLTGKQFVFTGVRDADLEKALEASGAEVGGSVKGTTSYVVAKDPSKNSSKLMRANELGVQIISLEGAWRLVRRG